MRTPAKSKAAVMRFKATIEANPTLIFMVNPPLLVKTLGIPLWCWRVS
ncbi:hypothetical protein KCP77_05130 [Salmonella enterica subsp. enterica]|nr:hypothetical protein KCP77_05130 [Salmonella enterica subsp. enterica]